MPLDSRAPHGAILVAALCMLAACGTTYTVPDADSAAEQGGASLSFWGTHPPNEKRLATVIATKAQIDGRVGLTRQKN